MSGEKTGGSVDYYTAEVPADRTVDGRPGYTVQCLEVIETLGMTFAEGEAFKAIWRSCAARTLGKLKADNDAKYNAEKVVFYGGRMLKAAGPLLLASASLPEGWTDINAPRAPFAVGEPLELMGPSGRPLPCAIAYVPGMDFEGIVGWRPARGV